MLSRGTHAFMCTGHNLWKNSGHESPLCDSMLAQSGKHATPPSFGIECMFCNLSPNSTTPIAEFEQSNLNTEYMLFSQLRIMAHMNAQVAQRGAGAQPWG